MLKYEHVSGYFGYLGNDKNFYVVKMSATSIFWTGGKFEFAHWIAQIWMIISGSTNGRKLQIR